MEPVHNNVAAGGTTSSPFRRPPRPKPTPVLRSVPAGTAAVAPLGRVIAGNIPAESAPPQAMPAPVTADARLEALERQRGSGGRWLYWIAGLTLINSALALAGQHWRFIIGLGFTQMADALAARSSTGWMGAALVDLVLMAGFVLLGHCAVRGQLWAFLLGIALYALDGLLFVVVRDWVGVGFHAFVLVMLFRGFRAARQL